jgi:hypothetical protein
MKSKKVILLIFIVSKIETLTIYQRFKVKLKLI